MIANKSLTNLVYQKNANVIYLVPMLLRNVKVIVAFVLLAGLGRVAGQSLVQNGGFEAGNFTNWTQSGDTGYTSVSTASTYVHTGSHGASLGPTTMGYLSQTLATVPGQAYVLSFWLKDAASGSPEIFFANWNATTVYAITNPVAAFGWVNPTFIVTANSASTVLQFGFENSPSYFGLDDISVTPTNFPPCTLTYTAGPNGSISGTSPQTVSYGGSGTEVTAVADANYHFSNWSDDSTANPRKDANVTSNITVTANFALTVNLVWDANAGTTGAQDGSGKWGSSAATWWDGSATGTWADNNLAGFGVNTTSNCTVTITNDVTPAGITFNTTGGGSYTLAGGGGGINLSGAPVITASNAATINAVLQGSGSLTKAGTGTLTVNGANTYSGGTILTGGTFSAGNDSALGTGPVTVNTNAQIVAGNGSRLIANAVTLNAGKLRILATGSKILTFAGGVTLTAGSFFNFKYHDSTALIDITNNPISGSYGFTLTDENNSGGTAGSPVLQLSVGGNTYAGNTTVASGTLQMNADDALPHGGGKGNVVLNGAASGVVGTLDLNGYSATINGLSGINNTLLGIVTNSSAAAATLTVGDAGTNSTFAGLIAGPLALTKVGAGTLTLSGANAYTGDTTISGGTLALGTTGSISSSSSISLAAGATLDVSAISAFALSGSTALSAAGTASAAIINGAPGGTVSLGSQPIILTYDGSHPALTILQGTLQLNGNAFTVNSASPLASGTYNIVSAGSDITSAGTYSVTGTAVGFGSTAAVTVSASNVVLTITEPPTISFYVSPTGNDGAGDGSIGNPWQSVAGARNYIRAAGLNTNMQGNIIVYLRGGRYPLSQTLAFTPADSGNNGFYITYKSYSNEVATLSGGMQVTNWSPVAGKPYWVASVPTNLFGNYFRQLYVNGIRAERAHSDWIKGVSFYDDPATTNTVDGVTFNASDLKNYSNVTDLRLLHIEEFKVDEFPVTGISTNATNGLIQVSLQQPYCQIRHDYGSRYFAATNCWMFVQAFEELDEPSEWYLNRATHQVYYYPYSYEDMTTAQVYAPVLQTLVSFTGASTTSKVQNIRFENITFEHGNWLFPRDYYIGGAQAEILYPGAGTNARVGYSFEVPGQIILNNTAGIQFVGNTIRHLGSCGIHLYNGTLNTLIQGNIFFDLTGAAVLGGRWGGDAGIPNQQICTNTIVADNVIRDIGADFMAATLIDNLQHDSFQVLHNDMADSQYAGFHERTSAGTLAAAAGQGGTVVSFNRISLVNTGQRYGVGDTAYLYSNGVWPGSTIQGNDINGLNILTGECNGMYFDDNSYGLTAISNVIHNVKAGQYGYCLVRFLTNTLDVAIENYGDATTNNFVGVTNINFHTFTGALPLTARDIVANAGLEPGYTNLLRCIYAGTNLAQGKFAWASSQAGTNQSPGAAVDWDYTTLWQPAANDTNNCWWAVDLGAAYAIQRIEIAAQINLNQPDARCNFQVQGANDSGFTNATVLSEQNSVPFAYKDELTYKGARLTSSWIKYVNNPQGFRYLRVIKTASGTLNFSEFQAFGYIVATNLTPYTLTYTAGPNGTISGTSPQTVTYGANGTAVTAVASANYYFVNWSDGSTANPRTDVNVTNNLIVTANFASLAAPMVVNSSMAANGKSFTLAGTGAASQAYVLLATTNLSPAVWLPVLTNSADANGAFSFTDLQVTNNVQRFYRVQAQ